MVRRRPVVQVGVGMGVLGERGLYFMDNTFATGIACLRGGVLSEAQCR